MKLLITIVLLYQINCYKNYKKFLGLKSGLTEVQNGPLYAVCILKQNNGSGVTGVVAMKQDNRYSRIKVMAKVSGLKKSSKHGFHIHEYGDMQDGCKSMGSHYNPNNNNHAGPNDIKRHVGDLGNVQSNDKGEVYTMFKDPQVSLYGNHNVLGRGCVVHEGEDDLGRGGNEESKKTGNAGGRIACGIVALAESYNEIDLMATNN